MSFENLVQVGVFMTDIGQLRTYARVRDELVDTAAPPASTTIGVTSLALPGLLVEVNAIAGVLATSLRTRADAGPCAAGRTSRTCLPDGESQRLAGARGANAPRRLDVGARLSARSPSAEAPALAPAREVEREPGAEDAGDDGEADRDPARGPGGRRPRRADKAGCGARREGESSPGAADRVLDRMRAEEIDLELLARSRAGRALHGLHEPDQTQLDLLGFVVEVLRIGALRNRSPTLRSRKRPITRNGSSVGSSLVTASCIWPNALLLSASEAGSRMPWRLAIAASPSSIGPIWMSRSEPTAEPLDERREVALERVRSRSPAVARRRASASTSARNCGSSRAKASSSNTRISRSSGPSSPTMPRSRK